MQNSNALFWLCKWKHNGVKHCDFWELFNIESLIYTNTNDEMSYDQYSKLNDNLMNIKKRLKLIEKKIQIYLNCASVCNYNYFYEKVI